MTSIACDQNHSLNYHAILKQTLRERVSDARVMPIFDGCDSANRLLVIILPQLGDFDSLEYAWWLQRQSKRLQDQGVIIRAVGIGNRDSGQKFSDYTGFPGDWLFVDPEAQLHSSLNLYQGLAFKIPGLSSTQNAFFNLMLMCAGIGSQGTLAEVFRGYRGDRTGPQLIDDEEIIKAKPLPPLKGSFFALAGGKNFQRPFELATLRLRNMTEVLSNWKTYVPNGAYLTQRGGTFLFDSQGELLYEHKDRGILGFAANMSQPLSFI